MRLRLFVAAVLALCCVSAYADPVTYTLSGTFSGTLGALSFSGAAGSIVFQGDTSSVNSLGGGFYTNTVGVSTFTVAGIGTAIFLSPTFGAESNSGGAGFFDIATGFGTSLYDPALSGYALTAPFSDTGFLLRSFATQFGTTALTSLGELSLLGDDGSPATFTAATTGPAVTPEPGSFALLLTGAVGSGSLLLRRLRNTAV